jgi:hypothetical protein
MAGVRFPGERQENFLFPSGQTGSGAHPASYQIRTRGFYLGIKRTGRESGHSHLLPRSRIVLNRFFLHSKGCNAVGGRQAPYILELETMTELDPICEIGTWRRMKISMLWNETPCSPYSRR